MHLHNASRRASCMFSIMLYTWLACTFLRFNGGRIKSPRDNSRANEFKRVHLIRDGENVDKHFKTV